jgi:hypothetical protein
MTLPYERRLPRHRVAAALALVFVGATVAVVVAASSSPGPFTGCLTKKGDLYNVAISATAPLSSCGKDSQVTFSNGAAGGPPSAGSSVERVRWDFDYPVTASPLARISTTRFQPLSMVSGWSRPGPQDNMGVPSQVDWGTLTVSAIPAECPRVNVWIRVSLQDVGISGYEDVVAGWVYLDTSSPIVNPPPYQLTMVHVRQSADLDAGHLRLQIECASEAGDILQGNISAAVSGSIVLTWQHPARPIE